MSTVSTGGETLVPAAPATSLFTSRDAARTARVISWLLAGVMAGTGAAGLWVPDLYRDPSVVVAATRGTDLIAVIVIAPLLAWSTWASARGEVTATLVWLGVLAYSTYVSAFAVFGLAFNDVFLAHLAMFALSVYGLVFAVVAVDGRQLVLHFGARTPARMVATLLLMMAVAMVWSWGLNIIRWSLTGELPTEAFPMPLDRVHLGYVMDVAVLAPAAVISALLLWRRRPWGYVLGTVVMTAVALVQIAYLSMQAFMWAAGVPGVAAVDVAYLPFIAIMVLAAAVMLRSARRRRVDDS
jgi:hypothetical protein